MNEAIDSALPFSEAPALKRNLSPTTNRRESRDRATIVHLSKALVQRAINFVDGKIKVQYLPLHLQAPQGAAVKIVVAPDKGTTYKRNRSEVKPDRPGLRRRYALSGRELTVKRLARRYPKPLSDLWDYI